MLGPIDMVFNRQLSKLIQRVRLLNFALSIITFSRLKKFRLHFKFFAPEPQATNDIIMSTS